MRVLLTVFTLLSFAVPFAADAARAAPVKNRSILVMEMRGDPSVVDAGTLQTITSTVSVAVSKRKGLNVLTAQDVQNLVDVEAQKQMMGCTAGSESCLAEVASAMGADLVLSGDVGKLGSNTVINLHLFDAAKARSVGRDSVVVADLAQLPNLLEVSVGGLLAPVTGDAGLASKTSSVAIPTVDAGALKAGGLQAINMDAEKALEHAMDLQEDQNATPELRRDGWCALAQVGGANPYLGPAQKACDDWTKYVIANNEVQASLVRDYRTLQSFLQLKRKTKAQRMEAIDAFLGAYGKLKQEEVENVKDARKKVSDGDDDVSLPDIRLAPTNTNASNPSNPSNSDGPTPAPEPDGPSPFHFGIPALNFDSAGLGFNLALHVPVMDDIAKFDLDPQLPPALVFGTRFYFGPLEGGLALDLDFQNGALTFGGDKDGNNNGFVDDADGDSVVDNNGDGPLDDVDGDPDETCVGTVDGCVPLATPTGKSQREVLFLGHTYAGLRTISFGVSGVTLLAPAVGVDAYFPFDFSAFDVGAYVANNFAYGPAQLRVFGRSHIAGLNLVRSVQVGVDLVLDAEIVMQLLEVCAD